MARVRVGMMPGGVTGTRAMGTAVLPGSSAPNEGGERLC